jgi:hypothetical protein
MRIFVYCTPRQTQFEYQVRGDGKGMYDAWGKDYRVLVGKPGGKRVLGRPRRV